MTAAVPRVVVEVLSPTTRDVDTISKLEEYKAVASLSHIVAIEPNAPEVMVWVRGGDGSWQQTACRGLEEAVAMPEVGVTLPLAEIYDGVVFPMASRPVTND